MCCVCREGELASESDIVTDKVCVGEGSGEGVASLRVRQSHR